MKKASFIILPAIVIALVLLLTVAGCGDTNNSSTTANADIQKQLDDIKAAIPKFAVPMREVGDRFDNMFFAAKGGNWALAAYMSKYLNNAMNPAKLTKPDEYPTWTAFYTGPFDPVNKAINGKDFSAFETAYTSVISACNGCHTSMGYKFIVISKADAPVDTHYDYNLASEPGDVPK